VASEKNILLIAYYFPPLGMGGVGRPFALFRHLPQFGYNVTVLTVKDIAYHEYDHSRLSPDDESKIIRAGSYDPSRIMRLFGIKKSIMRSGGGASAPLCYFPDSKRGWVGPAFRKARKLLTGGNYDAVITTSPPPSVHLVGMKIKALFGIPWIADFRDFWFSQPIEMVYRTSLQKKYALRLKGKIVETADAVVGVNRSIADCLGRGEVITNGSDIETAHLWQRRDPQRNDRFIIGVLGTINHLCPIEPLFKAVAALIENDREIAEKIKIVHVGGFDQASMSLLLDKYGLRTIVSLLGYLPKNAAIAALSSSDILYFSVAEFGPYHILPGRIFDYLMSDRPIIGAVPSGSDAEALLKEYDNGIIVTDQNTDTIEPYIRRKIKEQRTEIEPAIFVESKYEKYSTVYMAKRYAELLDQILK